VVLPGNLRTSSTCPFSFLVGLLLLAVALTGCGVPGPPVPPTTKIPAVPTELTASQVGERVLLRWTLPRLNTDGTRIEGWPQSAMTSRSRPMPRPAAGGIPCMRARM